MRGRVARRTDTQGGNVDDDDKPTVSNLDWANLWGQVSLWLKDAVTFHPWEVRKRSREVPTQLNWFIYENMHHMQVVSSYELAPTSLFVLRKDNLVRKPLIRLVRLTVFEWVMLTVILANCVTLTMQSNKPGFDESALGRALALSDVVFISMFIFEAACKIIALGFVLDEHTYLRSGEKGLVTRSIENI